MKLKLSARSDEDDLVIIGEGDTVLHALGEIDKQLFALCSTTMADDFAIEWGELIDKLNEHQVYHRHDFSSPEDDFDIEVVVEEKLSLGQEWY